MEGAIPRAGTSTGTQLRRLARRQKQYFVAVEAFQWRKQQRREKTNPGKHSVSTLSLDTDEWWVDCFAAGWVVGLSVQSTGYIKGKVS